MTHNRRSFLKAAGITTAAVSAAPLALGFPSGDEGGPGVALAAPDRSYTGGRFALEIDGRSVGFIGADGGMPYGEVVTAYIGDDPYPKKHIGNVKFEDITMTVPVDVGDPLRSWITAMLNGTPQRKSGSIIYADFDYKIRRRLDFRDALISEVTIPALDGASKEAGYLKIVISPESTTQTTAAGDLKTGINGKQKTWQASNFRFNIDGVETKRVSKVDSFTIKQGIIEANSGETRESVKVPGRLEYPNLTVEFSEADIQSWQTWFDDFVVAGNNSDDQERQGSIELLTPDLKASLLTLRLRSLGIFKLAPSLATEVARWEASLYMEGATFPQPDK